MLERIEALRLEVWQERMGSAARDRFSLDSFDAGAWHVLYLMGEEPVAAGRLVFATSAAEVPDQCSFGPYLSRMRYPIGVFNRLVVKRGFRRRGIAGRVHRERLRIAREHGIGEIWLEAEVTDMRSRSRLGFTEMGPSPDESVVGDWRIMRWSADP